MRKAGLTNCGVEVVVHLTGVFGTHPPPVQLYHRKRATRDLAWNFFWAASFMKRAPKLPVRDKRAAP